MRGCKLFAAGGGRLDLLYFILLQRFHVFIIYLFIWISCAIKITLLIVIMFIQNDIPITSVNLFVSGSNINQRKVIETQK